MTDDDIDKLIGGQERTATPTVAAFKEGVRLLAPPVASKFERYRDDPVGYVRDVLRLEPWSMQQDMLRLCASPPNPADGWYCKLALGAGTNAGKTAFGAMLINWSFDCRGPCIEQTTAPSQNSVVDVLWKEVRIQRCRADARWGIGLSDFIGPRAPEMRRAENWYAKGTVAQSGDTFKGRHGDNMVWLFDESPGIMDHYFEVTKTMFKPDGKMLWICLYNPTDSTSALYQEIMHPNSTWTVEELSTLDHPNIIAALEGREPPIPNAVTVEQMEEAIANDCDVVLEEDVVATDFQWKDVWYRPGSLFEWAFLGRWPTGSDADLWPDALWKSITEPPLTLDKVKITVEEIPQIGMDMATKGDNRDIVVA